MTPPREPGPDPSVAACLEAHGLGQVHVRADGTVGAWSPILRAWTGWDPNQAVGRPFLSLIDPGPAVRGPADGADSSGTIRSGRDAVGEALRAEGETVPVQTLASLRGARGQLVSVLLAIGASPAGGFSIAVVRLETAEVDLAAEAEASPSTLIGASGPMVAVKRALLRAARSDASVLITGESGTGKELAARAIHEHGARRTGPFVAVNCSAFQPTLLESELFGHVRGAFTGADTERTGLIAHADGGTLFLDEVGEIDAALQAKLLRVLQEREVRPVGANDAVAVDVRLVSATHRSPDELLASGRLRADFYYRIRVLEVTLPPLRERIDDIALLAGAFLRQFEPDRPRSLSREALGCLQAYPWPGNVRQLRNAIEHATVATDSAVLTPAHLPRDVLRGAAPGQTDALADEEIRERSRILEALELFGWNRTRAAESLGMSRVTLWKKIRRYRLDPTPFRGR